MPTYRGKDAQTWTMWHKAYVNYGYHVKMCLTCNDQRKCAEGRTLRDKAAELRSKLPK